MVTKKEAKKTTSKVSMTTKPVAKESVVRKASNISVEKPVEKTKKSIKKIEKPKEITKVEKQVVNEYGFWSVIFGILGLFVVPVIFGTTGIVLGILGVVRNKKDIKSICGIVLSAIGIIFWILWAFSLISF